MARGIWWISALFSAAMTAQQAPFIAITGPNAPKGATALFEDRHGGVWMAGNEAGSEGLTYFDGSRFIPVLKDSFPKVLVGGMAQDSEGGLWIASSGGLFRLFNGRLQKQLGGRNAQSILDLSSNAMLATSDAPNGQGSLLLRIRKIGDAWRPETMLVRPYRIRISTAAGGKIAFPCPGGFCEMERAELARWVPGQPPLVTLHPIPVPAGTAPATNILQDRHGCVWMRSNQKAWVQCPGESHATLLPPGVAGRGSTAMAELSDGSVVIASFATLSIGRPGAFRVIGPQNGYPSIGGWLPRKDGTLWFSNANGLFVFSPQLRMEFWTERDGLGGNTWSILPMGKKTFAIAGEQIRVLDEDRSRWLPLAEFNLGTHLAPGPGDTFFASSQNNGVWQITLDGRIVRKSAPKGTSMLAQTKDGQTWALGGDIAAVRVSGSRLVLQPANPSLRLGGGMDMKADRSGGLWACTGAGLVRKDEVGWHVISTKDTVQGTGCLSLAVDQKGDIWYAYPAAISGFSLLEHPGSDGRIRHFVSGGEVGNATEHFFGADLRGWLWRGTPDGVYVADLEQAREGQWLYLNRQDGLPGVDTNQRSFAADADGSVWFGIDNSVIHMFLSDDFVHPSYAPDLFVSGFSRNAGAFQMANAVDRIASGDSLTAHIGSLQFDRRNALRLRYRLLPEQAEWKPERSLDIALGKLPWGTHRLQVQGRLGSGPWSQVVEKSFMVLKPFWLTWPVLLGFAVTGGAAGVGGYRWRRKRRSREEVFLPTLTQWRLAVLSPDLPTLKGTLLDDRFEVGDVVARGGFATVFKGRDRQERNRPCAIKIFRQDLAEKSSLDARFQEEVTALRQVDHPNVVRIYGHGALPHGAPYLAMEFIEGRTLRQVLKSQKLDGRVAANYLRQVGNALAAIHAQRISHRDVKPENLMIRNRARFGFEVVLIDFSIALVKDPDETMHGLSRAAGTIHYMAPEQAMGYADASSDIYSLAKVVIEMLTGQRLSALLPKASMDLPSRVRELLGELGLGLRESTIGLLSSALEFDPGRRPKDARAFAEQICRDLEGESGG